MRDITADQYHSKRRRLHTSKYPPPAVDAHRVGHLRHRNHDEDHHQCATSVAAFGPRGELVVAAPPAGDPGTSLARPVYSLTLTHPSRTAIDSHCWLTTPTLRMLAAQNGRHVVEINDADFVDAHYMIL